MIRPATVLTALLAAGSGLYLYQAKHHTHVVDGQIAQIETEIQTAQARISLLRAEWALENSPIRLADLAGRYLSLEPMKPSQAVSFSELASRLPPVAPLGTEPHPPGEEPQPVSPLFASLPDGANTLARYASLDLLNGASSVPASSSTAVASSRPPSLADITAAVASVADADVKSLPSTPAAPASTAPMPPAPAASAVVASLTPPSSPATPHPAGPRPAPAAAMVTASLPPPGRTAPIPLTVPGVTTPAAAPRAPAPPPPRRVAVAIRSPQVAPAALPHAIPAAMPLATSALGGAYPNLPPPAPLTNGH